VVIHGREQSEKSLFFFVFSSAVFSFPISCRSPIARKEEERHSALQYDESDERRAKKVESTTGRGRKRQNEENEKNEKTREGASETPSVRGAQPYIRGSMCEWRRGGATRRTVGREGGQEKAR
jgi:hypothetical protein